eukprot:jgi/Tetstr1/426222/TSEL_001616.t1
MIQLTADVMAAGHLPVAASRRRAPSAPLPLAAVAIALALLGGSHLAHGQFSDGNCGSHGRSDPDNGGACVCDTPHPEPGQQGWTGTSCDIEVYGAAADGSDETAACAAQRCNLLPADSMRCWSFKTEWMSRFSPWNFLTLQLDRTSEEGDPDLYGMFWGGSSGEGRTIDQDSAFFMAQFDFEETSSSSHPLVGMSVNKELDIGLHADYAGVYLCVHAYGQYDAEFSLRASTTLCPSSFSEDGELLTCSTRAGAPESERRYDQCVDGACSCRKPYRKPFAAVPEGVGFESCAAEIVPVMNEVKATAHRIIEHDTWTFFTFNVTKDDYEVAVNVFAGEAHSNGNVELYLSHSVPPSDEYGMHDLAGATRFTMDDADREEAKLSKHDDLDVWREGLWYAGVRNTGMRTPYNLEVIRFQCPSGCNGHGQCTPEHICLCNRSYMKEDCSATKSSIAFDREVATQTPEVFETVYFELPPVDTDGHVEVTVTVQCWSSDEGIMFEMVTPQAYLKGSDVPNDYPTYENYTMRQDITAPHHPYSMYIPASQLSKRWILAIENPSRTAPLAYSVRVSKQAFCPNGCTNDKHGTCAADGVCRCSADWMGADCAIPASACKHGTFRAQHREEDRGTCWQRCECAGSACDFGSECTEFTCQQDPKADGAASLRRVEGKDTCVEDECTADLITVNAEAGYVCTQACDCPDDGGPCRLAAACAAGSKVCLAGSTASQCSSEGADADAAFYKPKPEAERRARGGGIPTWGLLLGMLAAFLGGTGLMMWLVIRRDKQRGNSLHMPYAAVAGQEDLGDTLLADHQGQQGPLQPPSLEEVVPSRE